MKKIVEQASSILYPSICLHCEAQGKMGIDLCIHCHKKLPWITNACKRCALPLTTESSFGCGACNNRKLFFDQAFVPFLNDEFIRECIHQFKFNNRLNHGKLLATLLLNKIKEGHFTIPNVLLPVPLYRNRIKQRGFNQALEIARIVNKEFNCSVSTKDIRRVRNTKAQMELPATKRHTNVKNAFQLTTYKAKFKDKHVAIIDDVMTTGSTVNEVAKCLRDVNARRIDVWCIARTGQAT